MKHAITGLILLTLAAPVWTMEQAPAAPRATAAPATSPTAAAAPASDVAMKEAAALQPAVQTSASAGTPASKDRIELETTQITGNRELPRVLYVVPWKRPDLGDLGGKPANSLLDEVLAPVDRDVFRRQNRYYQALKPDAAGKAMGNSSEGEK
jgi:hypothetical protein